MLTEPNGRGFDASAHLLVGESDATDVVLTLKPQSPPF